MICDLGVNVVSSLIFSEISPERHTEMAERKRRTYIALGLRRGRCFDFLFIPLLDLFLQASLTIADPYLNILLYHIQLPCV